MEGAFIVTREVWLSPAEGQYARVKIANEDGVTEIDKIVKVEWTE